MEDKYLYLFSLAVILLSTKFLGLISRRVQLPAVVGALISGIILGPSFLDFIEYTDFIQKASEIGVILLMFMAGLDTDLDELKKKWFSIISCSCVRRSFTIVRWFPML